MIFRYKLSFFYPVGKFIEEHDKFWVEIMLPSIKTKFGEIRLTLTPELVPRPALFQRCCELTGVRFGMNSPKSFNNFAGKKNTHIA